ncbi:MAG: hypothetical protein H6835_15375 [Planctomycetes bacterium]|nr:hypothetical protein [Planctomycetota bacterium]
MSDFHLIWRDQCDAAEGIRERFGARKALGYLIGEKLVNYANAAMTDRDFAAELPKFACVVRDMFTTEELRDYLDNVKRIGALGHVCSDEEHDFLRTRGAIADDPVRGARDILLLDQVRALLLER